MSAYTVLFGKQVQSKAFNDAVVSFVKEFTRDQVGVTLGDWDEGTEAAYDIGTALNTMAVELANGNVDPAFQFYMEMFIGAEACEDIASSPEVGWESDSCVQENGKHIFYMYEATSDGEVGTISPVDDSEAEEIVQKIITTCPPSERDKLPTDDKLAALLLSRSYWTGLLE